MWLDIIGSNLGKDKSIYRYPDWKHMWFSLSVSKPMSKQYIDTLRSAMAVSFPFCLCPQQEWEQQQQHQQQQQQQ